MQINGESSYQMQWRNAKAKSNKNKTSSQTSMRTIVVRLQATQVVSYNTGRGAKALA